MNVWGPEMGKGGVSLTPSDSPEFKSDSLPSKLDEFTPAEPSEVASSALPALKEVRSVVEDRRLREWANIDITSPILLSHEAKTIIAKLRRAKDEAEDWAKWADLINPFQGVSADISGGRKSFSVRKLPKTQ
jgi:hypothetical protein